MPTDTKRAPILVWRKENEMTINEKLDKLAFLFREYERLEDCQKSVIRKMNKVLKVLQDEDYMPYEEIVFHVSVRVCEAEEEDV